MDFNPIVIKRICAQVMCEIICSTQTTNHYRKFVWNGKKFVLKNNMTEEILLKQRN